MKAQAVPSFLVDGKWLNFFCRTMKELGSSFPSLVLTRFFALMHPPITRSSRVSGLNRKDFYRIRFSIQFNILPI